MVIPMIDYHLHSHFSIDSSTPLEAFIPGVMKHGLQEIGFSEHVDLDPHLAGYNALDFREYRKGLTRIRDICPVPVRCGMEISYQSSLEDTITSYIASNPCDYIIGSVHEVKGRTMDHAFYEVSSPGDYFEEVKKLVNSGLCDIVGHMDYFKQWGGYNWLRYKGELTEIFQIMIERELVLEINTAGFRHGCGEPYPSFQIQQLYRNLGGNLISLGSDAHIESHLAFQFPGVICGLKAMGFFELARFENRQISVQDM
jgi:histidinol-phosphatase (PHP family)